LVVNPTELVTERLRLRWMTEDDAGHMLAIWNDPGFVRLPEFRGRGYALEAARAVLAHARDDLGIPEILAVVSPANARSTQLLEKVGMSFRRKLRMPNDDRDVALYGISLVDRRHD
jgi:RimJ/RimL family protein N-acetyltransferase